MRGWKMFPFWKEIFVLLWTYLLTNSMNFKRKALKKFFTAHIKRSNPLKDTFIHSSYQSFTMYSGLFPIYNSGQHMKSHSTEISNSGEMKLRRALGNTWPNVGCCKIYPCIKQNLGWTRIPNDSTAGKLPSRPV